MYTESGSLATGSKTPWSSHRPCTREHSIDQLKGHSHLLRLLDHHDVPFLALPLPASSNSFAVTLFQVFRRLTTRLHHMYLRCQVSSQGNLIFYIRLSHSSHLHQCPSRLHPMHNKSFTLYLINTMIEVNHSSRIDSCSPPSPSQTFTGK
jgi:hypothetical protein